MNKKLYTIFLIFPLLSAFAMSALGKSFTVRDLYQPLSLEEEQQLIPITIITKRDIKSCVGCNLTDILERAGAQVQRFNPQFSQSSDTDRAYVTLRGVSNTQTLLLVDGVPWEDSTISRPPFWNIPLHHVENIEILKGPSGLGNGNVGGSINIVTQKAVDCSPKIFCADGGTQFSSESNTGHTAYVNAHFRSLDQKTTGLRLGFQGDKSEDPETIEGGYGQRAFSANLDHQIGQWLVDGSTFIYDSHNNSKPTPFIESRDSHVASLGTTYYVSPEQLFRVSLGYDKNKQFLTGSSTEYLSRSLFVQLETLYRFDFRDGKYTLTAGVEGRRERVDSAPRDEYEYKQRNTRAAFTKVTGNHGPMIYRVIVRADELSGRREEQVFTWSGAASYRIAEIVKHNVFIRGGAGKSFRDPGFDEKYASFGNPDLPVEEAMTHEIGFRVEQRGGSYFLDVSTFETELENPVVIPVREELDGEAYMRGVEMQAGITFGSWDGQVNYTNINTDNADRLRAHEVVKHLGSIRVSRAITPNWTVDMELIHKVWEDSSFADESSVLDVFLIREMNKNMRIAIAVRNLTDEKGNIGFNTEGLRRTVFAELEIRF